MNLPPPPVRARLKHLPHPPPVHAHLNRLLHPLLLSAPTLTFCYTTSSCPRPLQSSAAPPPLVRAHPIRPPHPILLSALTSTACHIASRNRLPRLIVMTYILTLPRSHGTISLNSPSVRCLQPSAFQSESAIYIYRSNVLCHKISTSSACFWSRSSAGVTDVGTCRIHPSMPNRPVRPAV